MAVSAKAPARVSGTRQDHDSVFWAFGRTWNAHDITGEKYVSGTLSFEYNGDVRQFPVSVTQAMVFTESLLPRFRAAESPKNDTFLSKSSDMPTYNRRNPEAPQILPKQATAPNGRPVMEKTRRYPILLNIMRANPEIQQARLFDLAREEGYDASLNTMFNDLSNLAREGKVKNLATIKHGRAKWVAL